jgi:hypothetical protein
MKNASYRKIYAVFLLQFIAQLWNSLLHNYEVNSAGSAIRPCIFGKLEA